MNCWNVLCRILGEDMLHIVSNDDLSDTVGEKINILIHWEVLFQGAGMFAVTDQGHAIILLPTLESTDPLHLAIAIHEAHHAKRWQKRKHLPTKGIGHWLEERATNRESLAFAKTIATGAALEDMISVFRASDITHNPLILAQGFVIAKLLKFQPVYMLCMRLLNHRCYRKTGEDFKTQFLKRQARLMHLPEQHHTDHESLI